MATLATIPEISITLVGEMSSNTLLTPPSSPSVFSETLAFPESPVFSETRFVTTLRGRLVVPPRPSDGPSRRTLVQRGLRLGSFRLNCAESVGVRTTTSMSSTPSADIASTRRAFNWSRSPLQGGMGGMGGNDRNGNNAAGITRAQSHRGHSRARSLNSLADLNETFKMNVVQPNNNAGSYIPKHQHGPHPRTPSIDLSILNFTSTNSSNPSHNFASAL